MIMSAFICNDYHISLLAAYAGHKGLSAIRGMTVEEAARTLHSENVKSVNFRYQETPDAPDYFKFDKRAMADAFYAKPVAILKAAKCLDYQSCEHDGWKTSKAKEIVDAIISNAIYSLDGYEDAQWEIAA